MSIAKILQGKKQYFTQLPVSVLSVDNSYQKPLSKAHVGRITKSFDPMGVGQIHVSRRDDGTYWVFDGQHRTAAYRELGIEHIDCIVYEGLSIEDESKGYVFYNNTMKQTQLQRFKAELQAGVSEVIEINNIVNAVGLGVDYDGSGQPIRAAGAIKDIYFKHGGNDLRETLSVLKKSFGSSKQAYQAFVIKGVHKFLQDYKDNNKFDKKWLINRYKKFGASDLVRRTNIVHSIHRGYKKDAVGLASIEMYNYNKSKDNKL